MLLDDGWGTGSNRHMCSADAVFVKNSLVKAGFAINWEKSIWEPVHKLEWLGLFWDSEMFSLYVHDRRVDNLRCNLIELISHLPKVIAKKLAKCVGKIILMMPVIVNIARLMTRRCYVVIENRLSSDSTVCLESNKFCINELHVWRQNIDLSNVKKFLGYMCPDTLVFSDASDIPCGSYVVNGNNSVFHINWSEEENVEKFYFYGAVYLVLEHIVPCFKIALSNVLRFEKLRSLVVRSFWPNEIARIRSVLAINTYMLLIF